MILLDTGPIVALCDQRDALHARAKADLERLKNEAFRVCLPVLTESLFHLPARSQRLRMRELLSALSAQPVEIGLNESIWENTFDWMEKYAEHEPDFADGWLAVLSGIDSRIRIWTYDWEFSRVWRKPDGRRIRLAVRME